MVSGKTTVCSLVTLSLVKVIAQPNSHAALDLLQQPKGTAPGVFQGPLARGRVSLANAASPNATSRIARPEATGPEPSAEPGSAAAVGAAAAVAAAGVVGSVAASPPLFSSASFSDIQQHWAKPFVELLAAKGIISGYGDGTFQPDAPISDLHFSLMVEQAQRYEQQRSYRPIVHHPGASSSTTSITASIHGPLQAARHNIPATMTHNGIRTRAQAAVFIYRSLHQTEYTALLFPALPLPAEALAHRPDSPPAAAL